MTDETDPAVEPTAADTTPTEPSATTTTADAAPAAPVADVVAEPKGYDQLTGAFVV